MLSERLASLAGLTALALLLCGCSGSSSKTTGPGTASNPNPKASQDQLSAGFILGAAPAGARNVGEAKKAVQEKDAVVLRGRIGGEHPFTEGRAMLTIADMKLTPCNEKADDKCPTPWDFCCDPKETILEHSASVQVLGADGKILKTSLQSVKGLAPLSIIVVQGIVAERPDPKVLVINATGIYIEKAAK